MGGMYVLPQLRQALQDIIACDDEPDLNGSVLTGYVVIAEWSAPNGDRWITRTAGDVNDDGPAVWTVKGWLWHALETTQRDADHYVQEDDDDDND